MNEKQEEHKTKLSKVQNDFLNLILTNPIFVFNTLSYMDIIKPLANKDLLKNGGKLGYRGIARKYSITENQARTLIKNIDKNISDNGTNNNA